MSGNSPSSRPLRKRKSNHVVDGENKHPNIMSGGSTPTNRNSSPKKNLQTKKQNRLTLGTPTSKPSYETCDAEINHSCLTSIRSGNHRLPAHQGPSSLNVTVPNQPVSAPRRVARSSNVNVPTTDALPFNVTSPTYSVLTSEATPPACSQSVPVQNLQPSAGRRTGRKSKYSIPDGADALPVNVTSPTYSVLTSEATPPACSQSVSVQNLQPSAGRRTGRKPKYSIPHGAAIPFNLTSPTTPILTSLGPSTNRAQQQNKKMPDRPRGRPPKYSFSTDDIIPLNIYPSRDSTSSSTSSSRVHLHDKFEGISQDYIDIGDPIYVCNACQARLWKAEAMRGNPNFTKKVYSLCCSSGKVELPALKFPPKYLLDLFRGRSEESKRFVENVRKYNMKFSFTSMGGKIDHKVNNGRAPYVYRMYGQNYHLIGSLLPESGEDPKFSQLYIFDTKNEVENRINAYSSRQDNDDTRVLSKEKMMVNELKGLLDSVNPLVQKYRMARDKFKTDDIQPLRIKLLGRIDKDGRTYNLPTANEVAALIVGDIDGSTDKRDIVLERQSKHLKRISELHPRYLALQYPLLFPYAEDGYRTDIFHRGVDENDLSGHCRLTIREFFAYRLQSRVGEISLILMARKLLQQFIVDAYTMVENSRLNYIRNNQQTFRVFPLSSLYEAHDNGDDDASDMGNRVILPSSFTGGARYMQQNYLDAMAIVRAFG